MYIYVCSYICVSTFICVYTFTYEDWFTTFTQFKLSDLIIIKIPSLVSKHSYVREEGTICGGGTTFIQTRWRSLCQ